MKANHLIKMPKNWCAQLPGSDSLVHQNNVLIREVQHRVGNLLQIISSILAQDARQASSEEARLDLESAHRRIAAVASVQRHLDASRHAGQIHLASYLTELCQTLARSAVDDRHPITIEVRADGFRVPSAMAVNIGLVVAELVINVIKHAFPSGRAGGRIVVSYRSEGDDWRLTVSDDGVGMPVGSDVSTKASLGTGIVAALVRRLGASIKTSAGLGGVGASVTVSASSVSPAQGSAAIRACMWSRKFRQARPGCSI